MNNINLKQVYKEIHSIDSSLFLHVFLGVLIKAFFGYFDIIFLSFLIDNYIKYDYKHLIVLITIILLINFLFFIFSQQNNNFLFSKRILMHNLEKTNIVNFVNNMTFQSINNKAFQNDFLQYKAAVNSDGSTLFCFCEWVQNVLAGIVNVIISLALISSIFKHINLNQHQVLYGSIVIILIASIVCLLNVYNKKFNIKKRKINNEFLKTTYSLDTCINGLINKDALMEVQGYNAYDFVEQISTTELKEKGIKLKKKIRFLSNRFYFVFLNTSILIFSFIILLFYIFNNSKVIPSGNVINSLAGIYKFFMSTIALVMSTGQYKQIKQHLIYYFKLKSKHIDIENSSNIYLENIKTIEFKNVYFKYPNSSEYSLKNINFKISAGDKIAFVGQNGSGKTTIISLLCGLYECTEGEIYINGNNILSYSKKSLNECISAMFQDFYLLPINLYQSISMLDYKKTNINKINQIAKKVNLNENVIKHMKDNNDELLEDGLKLSGGEQQKIALIRCLYKNSSLIIFDEPTSKFDPIAEYDFFTLFNNLTKNKTAIYISHRLSSCKFCEKIFVMNDGEIIQQGCHNELVEDKNGKYFEMWNAQAQFYCI